MLDSGCVNHVCTRKGSFEKLQEGIPTKLKVANNSTVDVFGVGGVKFKTFSGAVHTLYKVAYVPELRRNLISLSQLDSQGYETKTHGGTMTVTKGNMVLMKGEL